MNLDAIAHDLFCAQTLRTLIAPVTARHPDFDRAQAYAVAARIHAQRLREGAVPLGRKIGFTNRNIWPQYGVYEPIWGYVYDRTVQFLAGNRGECTIAPFALPRIEPEVMFLFKSAPPRTRDPHEILDCIDQVAHGYEIVQSHFPDWSFQLPDTIADSALHGALLIGTPVPVAALGSGLVERLAQCSIELHCDDTLRERGCGSNVLDSPLLALAFLIDVLAQQSIAPPIAAGEWVTTGTLTAALPIEAGATWRTRFSGIDLPGLEVRFIL